MRIRQFSSKVRRFLRNDSGAATAEVVILTPVFLLLFGMVTDASMVFGRQAEILRIIQDSNRSLAVGKILTIEDAEDYISQRVALLSDEGEVEVTITAGIITSTVTVPASDLTSTGLFEAIDSFTLTVGASQMSEL